MDPDYDPEKPWTVICIPGHKEDGSDSSWLAWDRRCSDSIGCACRKQAASLADRLNVADATTTALSARTAELQACLTDLMEYCETIQEGQKPYDVAPFPPSLMDRARRMSVGMKSL